MRRRATTRSIRSGTCSRTSTAPAATAPAELFRNQTVALPVDTSGKLVNTDVNRPLSNHTDLAMALGAERVGARVRVGIQAFRYTFGYGGDVARGLPPVRSGQQSALTAGGTMRELLAAVMSSPSTFERDTELTMLKRNHFLSRREVLGTAAGSVFLAPLLRQREVEAQTWGRSGW